MTVVVHLEDYRPSPRYDSLPWTDVQIQEGTASTGPWVTLETQTLTPVDSDPANPAYRNFTTALGTAAEQWYRVIFLDALAATGLPTFPVQNVEDDRPASVSELARLLRVSASDRHNSLMRVLKAAAHEIDSEIGTADITGTVLLYSNLPDIAREVNLERAVEHWQQMQSPFGIIGLGDMGATYPRGTAGIATRTSSPAQGQWICLDGHPAAIMDALASQIDNEIGSRGTSRPAHRATAGESRLVFNPSPRSSTSTLPTLPGRALAFGKGNNELFLTVRAG